MKREQSEWLVVEPLPKPGAAGKTCTTCGVVLPRRKFIWNERVFSECPACRRKRSNREAQQRHYERVKGEYNRYLTAEQRAIVASVKAIKRQSGKEIGKHKARLKQLIKNLQTSTRPVRTLDAIDAREKIIKHLEEVRELALKEAMRGADKPFFEYINTEILKNGNDTGRQGQGEDQEAAGELR